MKIDLHVHTCEISPCGKVPAQEMARMYKEKGYDLIVVTDHLFPGLKSVKDLDGAAAKAEKWLEGYRLAKAEGEKIGLKVLLGGEARLEEYGNEDFLVYGLKEEDIEWMMELLGNVHTIAEMSEQIRAKGLFLVQAHPFRPGLRAQDTALLDGVEAFNGNPRHNSSNPLARAMALSGGLVMVSGSDAHQPVDVGRGGLNTPDEFDTNEQLLAFLRSGALRSETAFDSMAIVSEPIAK